MQINPVNLNLARQNLRLAKLKIPGQGISWELSRGTACPLISINRVMFVVMIWKIQFINEVKS